MLALVARNELSQECHTISLSRSLRAVTLYILLNCEYAVRLFKYNCVINCHCGVDAVTVRPRLLSFIM